MAIGNPVSLVGAGDVISSIGEASDIGDIVSASEGLGDLGFSETPIDGPVDMGAGTGYTYPGNIYSSPVDDAGLS